MEGVGAGTAVAAGMVAEAGTAVAAGMMVRAGTAVAAGMAAKAGTITADISAGTSADGAVRGGVDPWLRPTAGMDGAAQDLLAPARAGGIGATPGDGAGSAGGGVPVHGPGVASWSVPRSVSSSPHR